MHESFHPLYFDRGFVVVQRIFRDEVAPLIERYGRDIYAGGHFGYSEVLKSGLCDGSEILISGVRDPVERMFSLFKLKRRSPNWLPFIPQDIADAGFSHFANYCLERNHYSRNQQCVRISGSPDFRKTIEAISGRYAVVGSSHAMDHFVAAVQAAVADVAPEWVYLGRKNEADDTGGSRVDRSTAAMIRADSPEDCALVEWIASRGDGVFRR